jgi:hypothetical protein
LLVSKRSGRSITVLDLLILIAATGAGLGAIRALSPDFDFYASPYSPIPPATLLEWGWITASFRAFYISPLLAAWSLGLVALRLRQPRPDLRSLASQPGWSASCAAAVGVVAGAVMAAIGVYGRYGIQSFFDLVPYPVGVAVGAVWLHLAATGHWRPEPSWIDRAGRVLGAAWLAMIPLVWGRFLLSS